ncbi:Bcl-2-like protein 1 [Trichinella zimbabwensis]|uniref:Bcl-2-like protein 1 n=2 Tax=Trichinella TaxID=6333 RepID=A0A0V1N5B1_9BILA|nr:Bcl-2-like protein 1 [Trichinella zimbabwensis]KRZ79218.1 Bcl-2-like protein 1 [Trichinella papuae]
MKGYTVRCSSFQGSIFFECVAVIYIFTMVLHDFVDGEWVGERTNCFDIARDAVESEACVIACDYINHRLLKSNYVWTDCPDLPKPNCISLCMRTMGEELEQRYERSFKSMSETLQISPTTAYPTFLAICDQLFNDGIRWGRIVALYAFGGSLSLQCVRKNMPELVSSIADWLAMYTETHLSQWIIENGGWEGFVKFYHQSSVKQQTSYREVIASVGVVCAAIGVMAIGILMAKH